MRIQKLIAVALCASHHTAEAGAAPPYGTGIAHASPPSDSAAARPFEISALIPLSFTSGLMSRLVSGRLVHDVSSRLPRPRWMKPLTAALILALFLGPEAPAQIFHRHSKPESHFDIAADPAQSKAFLDRFVSQLDRLVQANQSRLPDDARQAIDVFRTRIAQARVMNTAMGHYVFSLFHPALNGNDSIEIVIERPLVSALLDASQADPTGSAATDLLVIGMKEGAFLQQFTPSSYTTLAREGQSALAKAPRRVRHAYDAFQRYVRERGLLYYLNLTA